MMGAKNLARFAAAALLWVGVVAGAQEPPSPPPVGPAAKSALGEALRLSDLLDVARQELGPQATLAQALARARELAPKPALGLGEWSAGPRGARVEVTSPILCQEIQRQCEAREDGAPGSCSCGLREPGALRLDYEF